MFLRSFTFNPFEENTYVIYDDTLECIIIDPGCYDHDEKKELSEFILESRLKPVRVLLTHAHIDHVLGNNYVCGKFNIPIQMSKIEVALLHAAKEYGSLWGVSVEPSPEPTLFIEEGISISFGNTSLETIFTPGHSPGSFSFYHKESKNLIAGDVLFLQSIGRTDLPGGDHPTLIKSIREKLLILNDDVVVHPGHGPSTTIGDERRLNPFLSPT